MADIDKNILIIPNKGQTSEPTMTFTGQANNPITLRVLDDNTLSFEGSAGQLFSISPSLTGTIFSVNDISGIPSIEVDDTGEVRIAEFSGNVGIGKASPAYKLDVNGVVRATSFIGDIAGNASTASSLATARTISLTGAVTGSVSFNGSSNVSITTTHTADPTITLTGDVTGSGTMTNLGNVSIAATVADDSHNHIISNVDGLSDALAGKQPIDDDLTSIAGLTGASGFLKKTAANTWSLDTNSYLNLTGGTLTGTLTSRALTPSASNTYNIGTSSVKYKNGYFAGTITADGGATIGGTLSVNNLTVNGTTTTINSAIVTIDDPIFTLGGDTAPTLDDNKDRGIEYRWHNGTTAKLGFFGYDDSTGYFTFIPDATNTNEVFSGAKGTIDANLNGNASTVTNGVYTTGSYSDPSWLTISKSKVGLSNVENTALSTWAGTTKITTVGAITATSVNKVTITAPATSATLTIANGKTFTADNTLTLSGTDGSTLNIGTGGTLASGAFASAYVHPSDGGGSIETALTGANIISRLVVNKAGHITGTSTRALAPADIGAATAGHIHTTYDRASSVLTGAVVFSDLTVTDGIVTASATRSLAPADIGAMSTTHAANAITTTNISNWNTAYGWGNHASAGYQPGDADLTAIAALTGTTGILRKTAANTWSLDTTGYTTNTGTVTSVGISVPTGLSVSGSPISTSGTIAISLTNGYSIPTTTVQTNWNTAYTDTSTATNSNTASKIVKRDASGNFSAGTITASLTGNATSANKVNNALSLKFDTDTAVEGTNLYTFDGSGAKTINIKGGTNVSIAKASGVITISATDTIYASASFTHSGLTGTHNLTTDLTPVWGNITSKPNTVSGYGITDAMTTAHPANNFTSAEVTNLRAGKLDDGSTPWASKLDASTYTSHADNASAHHIRYSDSEAVAAVNAKGSMSISITGSSTSCTGNAATATNATTHIANNGSDHSYINQSVTTSATPRFTRLGLGVAAGSASPLTLKINNANEFPSGMIALENAAAGEASIRFNSASTGTNSWYLGLNQGVDFKLGYSTSFTDGTVQLGISTSGAVSATSFNGITGLATASPSAHGTAAVGTSVKAAREDHVHASNNTTYSVGNGLTSSGTVFSLGTPTAITGTTTNAVSSTGHTHSISLKHNELTGTHNLTTDLKPTWGNVSGKPSFATVATSGSYSDLSEKPSIAYTSAIPADAFTTEEVKNLRDGKLDDGSTPWTNASNITSGTISFERLPAIAITSTYVKGTEAEHLALSSTTQEGDVVVRTDLKKNFIKNSGITGTMADWTLLETPDDVVTSVNGKAGVIVLVPSDIGAEASFTKSTAFNKNFETTAANIKMNGTVSVGALSTIARADHIHPVDTSRQATITGAATTITSNNLTASKALISNSSGKVAVSSVTDTELGYLSGVTSSIQTQLDGKQATHTHPYLSNTTSSTQSGYFGDIYLKDDTNASHYLKITNANDLTAERTLSIVTGNVNRTLDLTYSRATSELTNATVFSDIIVLNGAITGLSTRNLTPSGIGAEASFTKNTAFNKNFETTAANIKMNGTVSVGALSTIARADHIHPVDTSRAASSHSHGSITNDGKIGSNANLLAVTGTGGVLGTLKNGTSGQVLKLSSGLVPTWSTEYSYTHPSAGAGSIATALTGASVISKLVVNSDGHVTETSTRNLTLGDLGYSGDTNANNYTLTVATDSLLGGVKTGYTVSGKNYPVQLDESSKMYVNVPWVDTNTWRGIDTSPVSEENSDSISSGWAFTHNAATGNGAHIPSAGGAGTFLAGNGTFSTPPYPVTSVNTKTGPVVLTYEDVGASSSSHTHSTTVTHNATTLTLATGGTSDTVNGATATTAGVVTNGAQTWAGVKTFNSAPVSANGYTTGSATMVYNPITKSIDFNFV